MEASDSEARATYVFQVGEADPSNTAHGVDRLNVVLILLAFRREALYLSADGLGRWAVAVRLPDTVRWAREALVARVVHDDSWATNVESALRGGKMTP